MTTPWRLGNEGIELAVTLTPGASANRVLGVAEGRLRVSVTARAHDNQANAALVQFLARWLDIPPSTLRIRQGTTTRRKQVVAAGTGPDLIAQLESRLRG